MTVLFDGDLSVDEADRASVRRQAMDQNIRDFVLDLESLDFIDSRGLESLLWLQDKYSDYWAGPPGRMPGPHLQGAGSHPSAHPL